MKVGIMIKRILSIFTMFALVIGLTPVLSFADDNTYPMFPLDGKVYINGFENTPAPAGMYNYTFSFDAGRSTNSQSDPLGTPQTVTNETNGKISIPLSSLQWIANSGTYVYKIEQSTVKGYEPLIENVDRYGRDFFPSVQYLTIDTNTSDMWVFRADMYVPSIEKPGGSYQAGKTSSLMFCNIPVPVAKSQLTIKKEVNFTNLTPPDIEFEFEVTIGGEKITPNPTIKAGDSWTSEEFEEGTEYTIEEINIPEHFKFVKTSIGDDNAINGEFQADDTEIVYTNQYWSFNPGPIELPVLTPQSCLIIEKTIIGDEGYDPEIEFTFNVKIGDYEETITIKANDTWKSPLFNENTFYSVTEVGDQIPDNFSFWGVQVNDAHYDHIDVSGTLSATDTQIIYTNKYKAPKKEEETTPPPLTGSDSTEESDTDSIEENKPKDDLNEDKSDKPKTEIKEFNKDPKHEQINKTETLLKTGDNTPIIPIVGGVIFCALAVGMLIFVRRNN